MKRLIIVLPFVLAVFLAACAPDVQLDALTNAPVSTLPVTESLPPTPTQMAAPPVGSDIADLLANPPAPNESVEIDAYFSGANPFLFPGGMWEPHEDRVNCPDYLNNVLTDTPFLAGLAVLNRGMSNQPAPDAPWFLAATQETAQPGAYPEADLPYHARLRGHLGDEAFADCDESDRIFLVDEVVAVFAQVAPGPPIIMMELPPDFAEWPHYMDEALGFSFSYPPDWQIEPANDPALLSSFFVRYPERPSFPVMVRVHQGEPMLDRFGETLEPPTLAGMFMHPFVQDWSMAGMDNQHLSGFTGETELEQDSRFMAAYFSGDGRTYEIALNFPTGVAASQTLLTDYSVIVESFRLDFFPNPTPTAMTEPGDIPTPLPPGVPPPPPTATPSP